MPACRLEIIVRITAHTRVGSGFCVKFPALLGFVSIRPLAGIYRAHGCLTIIPRKDLDQGACRFN